MMGNAEFCTLCTVMTGVNPNDDAPIITLKEMTQGGLTGVSPWRGTILFQEVSDDVAICAIDLFPLFSP